MGDEYTVLLINPTDGSIREIYCGAFNIPTGQYIQTTVSVQVPVDYHGELGLQALSKHNGSVTAWLQVCEKSANNLPTTTMADAHY